LGIGLGRIVFAFSNWPVRKYKLNNFHRKMFNHNKGSFPSANLKRFNRGDTPPFRVGEPSSFVLNFWPKWARNSNIQYLHRSLER